MTASGHSRSILVTKAEWLMNTTPSLLFPAQPFSCATNVSESKQPSAARREPLWPRDRAGAPCADDTEVKKGAECALPYPAGWPRAPERFLSGSGSARQGHAEHGAGARGRGRSLWGRAQERSGMVQPQPNEQGDWDQAKTAPWGQLGASLATGSTTLGLFVGQAAKPPETAWAAPAPAAPNLMAPEELGGGAGPQQVPPWGSGLCCIQKSSHKGRGSSPTRSSDVGAGLFLLLHFRCCSQ